MCKRYSQEEVDQIVKEALENQLEMIAEEKRLCDIEEAIRQIQEDIADIKENSKKVGF